MEEKIKLSYLQISPESEQNVHVGVT